MNDKYYFPHYSDSRYDRRLKRLMKNKGSNEPYAIYFMLLEVLRGQENYKYPLDEIYLLEEEFYTTRVNIEEVVKFSGLFEVIEEEGQWFFSVPLIQAMMEKDKARINGIKGSLIRWYGYEKQIVGLMSNEDVLEAYYKEKDIPGHEIIAPYKTPNSTLIARKEKKRKDLVSKDDFEDEKRKYREQNDLPEDFDLP